VKPQHQGSLADQLAELIQLANQHGLYDAADAVMRSRETVEQIAAWFDDQAAKERDLLDAGNLNDGGVRGTERFLVYKAAAGAVLQGAWRKPKESR
jgi:hypothetical protein